MNTVIRIKNYQKIIKKDRILQDINLTIYEGTISLFIGANGSGKSTLIKSILGFVNYDGIIECKKVNLGYCPEFIIFPEYISLKSFLKQLIYVCDTKTDKRLLDKAIAIFNIEKDLSRNINTFSKGMRQKVNIIQSLIGDPDILIFDEPLSGLDEDSILYFIELIKLLKVQNKTVIIATHYHEMYNNVVDNKYIFKGGEIINEVDSNTFILYDQ